VSDIGFLLALAAPVAAVGWLSFRLIAICERANEADCREST
jgi:hypothetical protein